MTKKSRVFWSTQPAKGGWQIVPQNGIKITLPGPKRADADKLFKRLIGWRPGRKKRRRRR